MISDYDKKYDVIVVGAGHAGSEAALAAARMGHPTLLLTINLDHIAAMSCNPAIGGLAKGHLVKEIDALGGEMAKNADQTGIQFRRLNTRKGLAVQGSRSQNDRDLYRKRMKSVIEAQPNLDIRQAMVERILIEDGRATGIETQIHERFRSKTVILTNGTFLRGLIHIGLDHFPAGRLGDPPSTSLSVQLESLGFGMGRLKTGTPPRLNGRTIDYRNLKIQAGDENPRPFSFSTTELPLPQVPCHITYTNKKTHSFIREGLDRSPLYSGIIKGTGARYCPSIEDKVVRFAERERHQIFLEPEGLDTLEVYPNGLATSLPIDAVDLWKKVFRCLESDKPSGPVNRKEKRSRSSVIAPITPLRQFYDLLKLLDVPTFRELAELYCKHPKSLIRLWNKSYECFEKYDNFAQDWGESNRRDLPKAPDQLSDVSDTAEFTVFLKNNPICLADDLTYEFVQRELNPWRTRGGRFCNNAPATRSGRGGMDLLLRSKSSGFPVIGEVKVASDKNAFYALIQVMTYAVEMATPKQMKRLQEHKKDHFADLSDKSRRVEALILMVNHARDRTENLNCTQSVRD